MQQANFLDVPNCKVSPCKVSPPLKWAGGKRWLVPRLRELYQPHRHRRMVIPFAGGIGDLLGLCPEQALVNDTNVHLMNFYRWWREGLDADEYPDLFQNNQDAFLKNRRNFNELIDRYGGANTKDAAILFYYLLRTCFNGLCRFNGTGHFNVGYGKYKAIDYNAWLRGYHIPDGWEFTCGDFSLLRVHRYSSRNQTADYVYCDPPYDNGFVGYSVGGFPWQSQIDLVEWLHDHQGPVCISNAATARIINLYREFGYQVEMLDAPRRISCDGNRDMCIEVLAYKNIV